MNLPNQSALCVGLMLLSGCTVDFIPVHYSRINAAKNAKAPTQRGPGAPGAFKQVWDFRKAGGYLFDPTQIEMVGGIASLKASSVGGESRYPTEKATIETNVGISYAALDGFQEILGNKNRGQVKYQLSHDGSQWFYHDGSRWKPAVASSVYANTAAELNKQIVYFHSEVGTGNLAVKIYFVSPTGKENVELQEIQVLGVAPKLDNW